MPNTICLTHLTKDQTVAQMIDTVNQVLTGLFTEFNAQLTPLQRFLSAPENVKRAKRTRAIDYESTTLPSSDGSVASPYAFSSTLN